MKDAFHKHHILPGNTGLYRDRGWLSRLLLYQLHHYLYRIIAMLQASDQQAYRCL